VKYPINEAAVTESKITRNGRVNTIIRMLKISGSYKKNLDSYLVESSRSHYVDYSIHASILHKDQIGEMEFCRKKGITSFKIYMNLGDEVGHIYMDMQPGEKSLREENVEMNAEMIERIITNAASLGCTVLIPA